MAKLLGNPGMAKLLGNPGMAKLLGNPGYLDKGGHMAVHPGIIPGWPGYLGIPGDLDKGGIWLAIPGLSRDSGVLRNLGGNPGILGQGGVYGWPSLDYPGIVVYLGT